LPSITRPASFKWKTSKQMHSAAGLLCKGRSLRARFSISLTWKHHRQLCDACQCDCKSDQERPIPFCFLPCQLTQRPPKDRKLLNCHSRPTLSTGKSACGSLLKLLQDPFPVLVCEHALSQWGPKCQPPEVRRSFVNLKPQNLTATARCCASSTMPKKWLCVSSGDLFRQRTPLLRLVNNSNLLRESEKHENVSPRKFEMYLICLQDGCVRQYTYICTPPSFSAATEQGNVQLSGRFHILNQRIRLGDLLLPLSV
jgi:hypothetical protein